MKIKLLVLTAAVLLVANVSGNSIYDSSNGLFKIYAGGLNTDVSKDIGNAMFLELDFNELARINEAKASSFTLTLPGSENSPVTFDMHSAKILTDKFSVVNEKKEKITYTPGLYYQGTVAGINHSLAAFSMFDNSVMAVFSYHGENYVLGVWNDKSNVLKNIYILYKDSEIKFARDFKCGSDNLPQNKSHGSINTGDQLLSNQCIKIYFECDYQMFVDKGNAVNVTNYVTAVFNVVQSLFNTEAVNTEISEIFVWTTIDPYVSNATSTDYLNDFQATRTVFNGNLAHLLSTRNINVGGIAYLDVICSSTSNYAFSNIENTFNAYPTYSNTVLIVTHELGHNFGSEHTHWCLWPGGPIDNCVPVDDGPCTPGPSPGTNGGTIMSYCHLSVGTSLSNGFGPLPGNQIRLRYNAATCLTACDSPPEAHFSATPLFSCTAPLTVAFTDNSIGSTTSWAWDIDNNGTTDYTTKNPSHTYSANGTYTVRLIATNANGSDTIVKTNYINVGSVVPSVATSIITGSDSICGGTSVTFAAVPTNGGSNPSYEWYINGITAGDTDSIFTSTTLANNDVITCKIISASPCANPALATSAGIAMEVVTSVTPTISIAVGSGSATVCVGTPVTFNATSVSGGSNPVYQWKLNNVNTGANNTAYTLSNPANGDVVSCALTSNAVCPSPATVSSSTVTLTVNPMVVPTVSIALTSGTNPTCSGTPVTFTASATNGGATPVFQWKKNGFNTIIGSSYTPLSPLNGDVITCTLTSNAACLSANGPTSAGITISLISATLPTATVAITSGTNPSCSGNSATFTATAANAGTTPAYLWFVNGSAVLGAQSATYTPISLADGAVISCKVTSSAVCPDVANSNGITISVPPIATINFLPDINVCGGTIPTTVFASNPAGADFTWSNSNTAIGIAASGIGNIPAFLAGNITAAPVSGTITVLPSMSGCPGTPSDFTITIDPTAVITQNGIALTCSSANTYQWYRNGQPVAGATGQTLTATQNGSYSVIINSGNCPSQSVNVNSVSITELESLYEFMIYPNPNEGKFYISFEVPQQNNYTLKLVNALGELIYEETLTSYIGKYSKEMNLANYGKGLYLVSLTSADQQIIKKIIVY